MTRWWLFPPATTEVQFDETWAFVGEEERNCDPGEARRGDCWDHTATDPETRSVVSPVVGKRTAGAVPEVVRDVHRRTGGRVMRLVPSDEYPAYTDATRAADGPVVTPPRTGRPGRPKGPSVVMPAGVTYATVHEHREAGRVVRVSTRVVFGTLPAVALALLTPEYADIFGVPFSGFPVAGLPEERAPATPRPGKAVRAVPERLIDRPWLEVTFPRVVGYRFDVPAERLTAKFDKSHREVLTTQDIPTTTLNAPIVGEKAELTLAEAKALRPQAVAFRLATHLQQHYFPDKAWLFPQLLGIVRDWLGDPDGDSPNVDYGDDTFPGLLLLGEKKHAAGEKIARAIIAASGGAARLRAELPAAAFLGTTAGVSFDTIKDCWATDPAKCHFNLVPQDSDWETIVCQKLEEMDEVRAYAKNQAIGFRIPYTCDGRAGNYFPDLIVKLNDGRGPADLLNLVLEVSGQKKKEKDAKVQTAKTMWVPAVNNLGTFGRWAFLEIDGSNLHKTKQEIRKLLKTA